jgi:phosphoglycolate phosphatase-like HAD superfamily hydrolase
MTTALCFDLDGTLVHRTAPYEDVTRATFEAHGIDADEALVRTAEESFRVAFEAMEPDPFHRAMETALATVEADADPAAIADAAQTGTTKASDWIDRAQARQ